MAVHRDYDDWAPGVIHWAPGDTEPFVTITAVYDHDDRVWERCGRQWGRPVARRLPRRSGAQVVRPRDLLTWAEAVQRHGPMHSNPRLRHGW